MAHWLQLLQRFERRVHIRRPVLVGHSLGAGVAGAAWLADQGRGLRRGCCSTENALAFGGSHGWVADLLINPYYTAIYRLVTGSDWIVGRVLRNAWGIDACSGWVTPCSASSSVPFRVQGSADALKQLFCRRHPGAERSASSRCFASRAP